MPGRLVAIAVGGLLVVSGIGLALYLAERPASAPEAPVAAQPPPQALEDPAPDEPAPSPAAPARPEPTASPPEPVPTTGSLRIESDVPGTSVFVDREFLGDAPVTKTDLLPGSYSIRLVPADYDVASYEVNVVAGEQHEVVHSFRTIRLDASVAVVHKHQFGSCEGTLRGSPQGLTYETTNEDDGFVVAFGDIETLELDYLEANLLVKVRDGRSYNFTNEAGDADPLFIFHRDVDKVRLRVIGGGF